jgi:3-oxoacyl-(acyl-carrier-protein) synthase
MEAPISPLVVASLARLRELSQANDDPKRASRPFDCARDGFVLSEGSAILVLETHEAARARGARIYAELLGHASSVDGVDPYRVDATGVSGAKAIEICLRQSDLTIGALDYICANGNSSPQLDRKEIAVLRRAFGEHAARIPISSIKGVIGHPFGASGAFQVAAASLAVHHGAIPPTFNLEKPDPECDLDLVREKPRQVAIQHALVTSYGFGGLNAYIALRSSTT